MASMHQSSGHSEKLKRWIILKIGDNFLHILSLDPNFAPFLTESVTWEKKSRAFHLHGLVDDDGNIPTAQHCTAQQKVTVLELMLGQITNYCSVISHNTIVRNSTFIANIWQSFRHFGFQSTGAHFITLQRHAITPRSAMKTCTSRYMMLPKIRRILISHYQERGVMEMNKQLNSEAQGGKETLQNSLFAAKDSVCLPWSRPWSQIWPCISPEHIPTLSWMAYKKTAFKVICSSTSKTPAWQMACFLKDWPLLVAMKWRQRKHLWENCTLQCRIQDI